MLPLSALGFIRFDVEDFLTAVSDDALASMLDSMHRWEIPGSYGIVGKKAQALQSHGREAVLRQLSWEPSLGFHSTSHSEHPTLAEDSAQRSYNEAREHFLERERVGVEQVTEAIKAPRYFTQPGGNWVPEAAEALPQLGMDVYFTDSFNSYVIDLGTPHWYGEVLHLSFPVINPKPFGLGLPGNLQQAIELLESWQGKTAHDALMVMLHPTELVTYEFWDAVNFAHGQTTVPLKPAPTRTVQEQREALDAFDAYLQEIRHLDIEWCDVEQLRQKIVPRGAVAVTRSQVADAVKTQGWGPLELPQGTLSAAEALYALAVLWDRPDGEHLQVGYVAAPSDWHPTLRLDSARAPDDRVAVFARSVSAHVAKTGRLPSAEAAGVPLEQGMAWLLGQEEPLKFLDYIKAPPDLHWDWPIFPQGFRPLRLWEDARRLAWTIKRARYQNEGYSSR